MGGEKSIAFLVRLDLFDVIVKNSTIAEFISDRLRGFSVSK
jgi:hypothetical protein